MSPKKNVLASTLAAAIVLAVPGTALADLAARQKFSIPAQSLSSALIQFSKQADVQVVGSSATVGSLATRGISGEYTGREALKILLGDSALVFEEVTARSVRILKSAPDSGRKQESPAAGGTASALRLTQVGEHSPGENRGETPPVDEDAVRGVPELLVRGRRTSNADIQRTEDDVQPYVVFDAQAIERSMATTLEEFLRTRLPMNTSQFANGQDLNGLNGAFGNQSQINLRGLGTNQTLILVDGRRVPAVSAVGYGGGFNQPDINGITLRSIERIEVLPSTASGIYGGGATGGVINIITRRDYDNLEVSGSLNDVFDGSAAERRLGFNAGFTFGHATYLMVSGSHSDSTALQVGERDFAIRARQRQFFYNPTGFLSASSPPYGYTGNICAATELFPGFGFCNPSSPLRLARGPLAGTSLNSPYTHVPAGYAGATTDDGAAFLTTAGGYTLALSNDQNGGLSNLLVSPKTSSYAASLRREFGRRFEAFVDLGYRENDGSSRTGPSVSSVLLPAGAANNPFTGAVLVTVPTPGIAARSLSLLETMQASGGFLVRLPGRWTAHADYGWSRNRFTFSQDNFLLDAAGSAALRSGALDITRDANAYPIDYSPYLLDGPTTFTRPSDTILRNAALRLAGPLAQLPGGPLMLSALLEAREETASASYRSDSEFVADGGPPTISYLPSRWQEVRSAYLEITAPLVRGLEAQASIRRDRYETDAPTQSTVQVSGMGSVPSPGSYGRLTNEVASTDYTLGLKYSPLEDLTVRASYGTGFLAPAVNQLAATVNDFGFVNVIDPKRNGVPYSAFPVRTTSGGSLDLRPEESQSWSAGLIFTPRLLPGSRLSIDYTRIEKTGEIAALMPQALVDNEDALPGRVTRAPLTAGEIALGYTGGAIIAMDTTLMNISASALEAYDIQLDYGRDVRGSRLTFNLLGTWQPRFERRVTPGVSSVDSVGFSNGQLEWRLNGGVTLERGPWTAGWNAQHYASYYVYSAQAAPLIRNADVGNQGSNRVPAQIYHDLFVKYRWDRAGGWLAGVETTFGIQNVMDHDPPIVSTSASTLVNGGYSSYGDPRLRRYTLSLRKHFQ